MKLKSDAWFESEIHKVAHLLREFNQNHGDGNYCSINKSDLNQCPTYRRLVRASKRSSALCSPFNLLILILSIAIALFAKNTLWRLINPQDDPGCLIKLPDSLQNAFVPPNKCDFCRNLTSIERARHLAPEVFSLKYAYSKVPVVVLDGMTNWTAPVVFTYDYFKQIYTGTGLSGFGERKNCQFFPYKTEFRSLEQVFEMDSARANFSRGSAPWYIGWSNCDYSITNELRQHYHKPYFLPNDSESIRTDWIFMGTPNNGAHMHIDHVGRPSWQAQVRGTKRWFLEPPLECYVECNDHTVDVRQGDIIVLDTNVWYHKTLIVGDEVSITIGAEYD